MSQINVKKYSKTLPEIILKSKSRVKSKAKANKPKKVEVVEISDDQEPKDYSNILTKIEKIKDISNIRQWYKKQNYKKVEFRSKNSNE